MSAQLIIPIEFTSLIVPLGRVLDNTRAIIGGLSHRPPIDLYLVNAPGIQVPSDSSKGGIKLLRIIRIRKTTPEGDAVFCR